MKFFVFLFLRCKVIGGVGDDNMFIVLVEDIGVVSISFVGDLIIVIFYVFFINVY